MPDCIVAAAAAAIAGGINFRFDGKLLLFMVQLARQKFRQQNAAKFWHFKCKRQCASSTIPSLPPSRCHLRPPMHNACRKVKASFHLVHI